MSTSEVERNRERDRLIAGREVCERCRRPKSACYCASITSIKTKTRLVLLQHPRERYVAIGTAHMASLCIEGSELHVGIDWSKSEPLARALRDPDRPAILLYPGEGSLDIAKNPPPGPVTLVVVDGTWSQTKKVVRTNPILSALPRYAFVPPRPSEYRIRREPNDTSVSTIEALVHTLTVLEGGSFDALLEPFRAMIDHQIACEARFRGTQSRHAQRRARPKRLRVPRVLSEELHNVVLVVGEANSWPYAMRKDPHYLDELVHWVAFRPSTGEVFSYVVRPKGEIAPGTTLHTGLDEASLRAGGSLEELSVRWRSFVRDANVICSWGHYERNLFARELGPRGGFMPSRQLDLRGIARDVARGTVGSLTEYRDKVVGTDPLATESPPHTSAATVPGRAGRKLRALLEIVEAFLELSRRAAV